MAMSTAGASPRLLVTGATGYIGGRLVPRLLEAGYRVRCLVRDPARLDAELAARCEVVRGSADDVSALAAALADCDQAYYLIHAMRDRDPDFARLDREQARTFAGACRDAGVKRIIYLGGLGDADGALSEHLQSRQETGAALTEAGVPVLEFRAAVIVGSGSASFEMLRHLAERLPVMITPRWVRTRCQPIAVRDVLAYLLRALDQPQAAGIYQIGGDVVTYSQMLQIYAEERGLRRLLIPVPVLTPRLSSWWVHLVTPIPRAIASPLIEGLRCEVVAPDAPRSQQVFGVQPMSYREAVRRAIERVATGDVETIWHRSFSSLSDSTPPERAFVNHEGLLVEKHERQVAVPPAMAFRACQRIGGTHGWPGGTRLWQIRAQLDRLAGGVGFRRGRPVRDDLRVGDAVDFWRVEHVEAGSHLLLRAEMRLPGNGWLQLAVRPLGERAEASVISATAFFEPHGALGLLYWAVTLPLHRWVFPALTASLARRARALASLDHEAPAAAVARPTLEAE